MFTLNTMRKIRFDEVTTHRVQGLKIAKYAKLTVDLYTPLKFIRGPCPIMGLQLVIMRFFHYLLCEHFIMCLS